MASALCPVCGHMTHYGSRGTRLSEMSCRNCGRGLLVAPVRLSKRLGTSTWAIYQMTPDERAEAWRKSEQVAS